MKVLDPKIDNKYLYFYLKSKEKQIMRLRVGGALPNIQKSDLEKIKVVNPGILEQIKISKFFSLLDKHIELWERKLQLYLLKKKYYLNKMFCSNNNLPFLRFNQFDDKYLYANIFDAIEKITTGLNPRNNFSLNNGGDYKYVTIKNIVSNNKIDFSKCDLINKEAFDKINKRAQLNENDILFVSIGNVEDIGKTYFVKSKPCDWTINESVFRIRIKTSNYPKYFSYLFNSTIFKLFISRNISGSSFKSIKINQLKKFYLLLPNKEEQMKISTLLSLLDKEVEFFDNTISNLKLKKKFYQNKMFV